MAEKKITKRESFTEIREILAELGKERLVKVMEHELELLAKKNASGEGKMTASQIANEKLKADIYEQMFLTPNRLYSITDMQKSFECCADVSNQKISALLRQMIADGKVERLEEKRKVYFRVILG